MIALLIIIALLLGFIAFYLYKINENQKEFKETREIYIKEIREFYIKAIRENSKLIAYFTETPEYKKMKDEAMEEEVLRNFKKDKKNNKKDK